MMTEASKAKKIKAQENRVGELEKKAAALRKLHDVERELAHERNVLAVLRNAPTSDGGGTDPEAYDGSPAAIAAAESNAPDPSTQVNA